MPREANPLPPRSRKAREQNCTRAKPEWHARKPIEDESIRASRGTQRESWLWGVGLEASRTPARVELGAAWISLWLRGRGSFLTHAQPDVSRRITPASLPRA